MPPLRILYEDNHLLVIDKPAGLPTMGVTADRASLVNEAQQYLKRRYQKPGNVYLGVVSRLDSVASGVVIFARTSKAAARLSEQFRDRTVEKSYWAVVEGKVPIAPQECLDWLAKDERQQRMRTVDRNFPGAQEARLSFQVLQPVTGGTLVEVALETGRKHQIRVQLAERGHPIVGDRKYGSRTPFATGIALHARRLVIMHPVQKEPVELIAPIPNTWRRFGISAD